MTEEPRDVIPLSPIQQLQGLTPWSPIMSLEQASQRYQMLVAFVKAQLVEDRDWGKIEGINKPTLLKPGAEKLLNFFGYNCEFVPVSVVEDWGGQEHGGEPFFFYRYRCIVRARGGVVVGEGIGSCNSWEKKYRYRKADRTCPNCHQPAIIKGKEQYGGGWVCYGKKGGCGSKFPDGDVSIEGQATGLVLNPNPADVVNTIDKMGQKRSLIAGTLISVNASEFFTQDVEDMDRGTIGADAGPTEEFVDGNADHTPIRGFSPKVKGPVQQPLPEGTSTDQGGGKAAPEIESGVKRQAMPVDTIRGWLIESAKKYAEKGVKLGSKNRGMIAQLIEDTIAPAVVPADAKVVTDLRHEILGMLTGVKSVKDLSDGLAAALWFDWLGAAQVGKAWVCSESAASELGQLLALAQTMREESK
jgi:hypothetical protein